MVSIWESNGAYKTSFIDYGRTIFISGVSELKLGASATKQVLKKLCMSQVILSVAMQKRFFELPAQGMSLRQIARVLRVGRNTIKKILERGEVAPMAATEPQWAKAIDWAAVKLEVSRGVQLNILAREQAGDVISYVQFWRQLRSSRSF